jgi:hypothetical protein
MGRFAELFEQRRRQRGDPRRSAEARDPIGELIGRADAFGVAERFERDEEAADERPVSMASCEMVRTAPDSWSASMTRSPRARERTKSGLLAGCSISATLADNRTVDSDSPMGCNTEQRTQERYSHVPRHFPPFRADHVSSLLRAVAMARLADLDRLCLRPRGGFASTEEGKLERIVETAREVWG